MAEPTQEQIDQIFEGVHNAHRPHIGFLGDEACLDGHFSAEHLEKLAALLRGCNSTGIVYKYKKYIVFQCDWHYPAGGLGDITGSFDTLQECYEHIRKSPRDDNEIVDRDTWEVVDGDANS